MPRKLVLRQAKLSAGSRSKPVRMNTTEELFRGAVHHFGPASTVVSVDIPLNRVDEGFETLYLEQFRPLVTIAFLLTGSAAEAEDAVHDSFLRCAHRLGSIEHPPSYLRAVVVNECRSRFRLKGREQQQHRNAILLVGSESQLPHDLIETRDALRSLSDRKRAVIVLRYFVDLPEQEIADILQCRPSTVRSLAHRGLRELREKLQ